MQEKKNSGWEGGRGGGKASDRRIPEAVCKYQQPGGGGGASCAREPSLRLPGGPAWSDNAAKTPERTSRTATEKKGKEDGAKGGTYQETPSWWDAATLNRGLAAADSTPGVLFLPSPPPPPLFHFVSPRLQGLDRLAAMPGWKKEPPRLPRSLRLRDFWVCVEGGTSRAPPPPTLL